MNLIKKYWETFRANCKNNENKYNERCASRIFQITEHNHRLWFTYNGRLFCPCDMMKKEPLDALLDLRTSYIVCNSNN